MLVQRQRRMGRHCINATQYCLLAGMPASHCSTGLCAYITLLVEIIAFSVPIYSLTCATSCMNRNQDVNLQENADPYKPPVPSITSTGSCKFVNHYTTS